MKGRGYGQPRAASVTPAVQRAQLTVAFCAVDIEMFGSMSFVESMIWPAQPAAFANCQQGCWPPFDAHEGTVLSMKPPLPFEVWLTIVQSSSWVPGFLAIWPVMHGGFSDWLIKV